MDLVLQSFGRIGYIDVHIDESHSRIFRGFENFFNSKYESFKNMEGVKDIDGIFKPVDLIKKEAEINWYNERLIHRLIVNSRERYILKLLV